jgi:GDPmannose 4,6-dehydratase
MHRRDDRGVSSIAVRRALICGVTGQDGAYLARLLLHKGYEVWGTSRDAATADTANLVALGVAPHVRIISMASHDIQSVAAALKSAEPDEIYNLSGQSSVALSFEQPAEALESIALGALNLLEAVRLGGHSARLYNASSSECFGDLGGVPATEVTPLRPRSPYAVAKSSAHWLVTNYREAYGLFVCSGILFNHESPLRPERFVTRKIVEGVCAIKRGTRQRLTLGRLDIARDWGWAPEFVEAMWLMLQQPLADDFVIATGQSFTLEQFVATAFAAVGLDWHDHVDLDPALMRPTDLPWSGGDPTKAARDLGWQAKLAMPDVVRSMMDAAIAQSLL